MAHSVRIEILASYFSSLSDFVLVSLIINQPLKCGFSTYLSLLSLLKCCWKVFDLVRVKFCDLGNHPC